MSRMNMNRQKLFQQPKARSSTLAQDIAFFGASTCSAALSGVVYLPHTFGLKRYRNFIRRYDKGTSVDVPKDLDETFMKTLVLLKIDDEELPDYRPFMACGFDIVSLGTYGRYGFHIGLPVNFPYKSINDIDRSQILVNQESVIWESDAAKQLLNALVLSEKAKMFAIASEIKIRQTYKLYLDTTYAFFAGALTYVGSRVLNERLNLYNKPRSTRLISYALVTAFSGINYLLCKDITQNWYEQKVDKELKELDPVFAEGGREYFSKILERNKALRELMGNEGKSAYTVLGNENFLLRNKHRPIVQRREFFEQKQGPSKEKESENLVL